MGIELPDVIETERLILSRSRDERDKAVLSDHVKDPEEFTLWSGFVGPDEFIDEEVNSFSFEGEFFFGYSIFPKDMQAMVGYVALYISEESEPAEVEWYVFKEHRRRHYAEESLRALIGTYLSLCNDNGIEPEFRTWIGNLNTPSIELATKLGFKNNGLLVVFADEEDEEDFGSGFEDPVGALQTYTLDLDAFR